MSQQERNYFDHEVDPASMIIHKKMIMKEKILKYALLFVGAFTAFIVLLMVLQLVEKI